MGQTFSFLPSLITSCNLSNVFAPFRSKPSQQLNWQREDLAEGSNTERSSARMGWAEEFASACCARSRLHPGKRLASLQSPREKTKSSSIPGSRRAARGWRGEPGEPETGDRVTEDTRLLLGSAGRAQVLQRTTLKRATALLYSIKKQFPIKLPFLWNAFQNLAWIASYVKPRLLGSLVYFPCNKNMPRHHKWALSANRWQVSSLPLGSHWGTSRSAWANRVHVQGPTTTQQVEGEQRKKLVWAKTIPALK